MVFILLIRSLYQWSRPGWAACPGLQSLVWCICSVHPPAAWDVPAPTPLFRDWLLQGESLVLFTRPGQNSDIRECCYAVLALYGFLKACCLAQTCGSQLPAYWIFPLFVLNLKSLISLFLPFFPELGLLLPTCALLKNTLLPLTCDPLAWPLPLARGEARASGPALRGLLGDWAVSGQPERLVYCSFPGAHRLRTEATLSSGDSPRPRDGAQICEYELVAEQAAACETFLRGISRHVTNQKCWNAVNCWIEWLPKLGWETDLSLAIEELAYASGYKNHNMLEAYRGKNPMWLKDEAINGGHMLRMALLISRSI